MICGFFDSPGRRRYGLETPISKRFPTSPLSELYEDRAALGAGCFGLDPQGNQIQWVQLGLLRWPVPTVRLPQEDIATAMGQYRDEPSLRPLEKIRASKLQSLTCGRAYDNVC